MRRSISTSVPSFQPAARCGFRVPLLAALLILIVASDGPIRADVPSPVLEDLFPLGIQAGTSVCVSVAGTHLETVSTLRLSEPRILVEKTGDATFRLTAPADLPVGFYDVSAVAKYGNTGPRLFHVSRKRELIEPEGDHAAVELPMNSIVSGRIEGAGAIDRYRFAGRAGDSIVMECWANRIESQLRAVMELFDPQGRRLAVSRGESRLDPRIDVRLPADGMYELALADLTYRGGRQHFYRMSLGTAPQVDFALPTVLRRGATTRVTLFHQSPTSPSERLTKEETAIDRLRAFSGESGPVSRIDDPGVALLETTARSAIAMPGWDCVDVDVTVPNDRAAPVVPARLSSAQAAVDFIAYDYVGADEPVLIRVTDVPIALDRGKHGSPEAALFLDFPCEVSGQLIAGDEQDWYAFEARRGEVIWFDAFGERIGSPVDLDLMLLDHAGQRELLHMRDQLESAGLSAFPTTHLDPGGRWVVPADGRYLLLLRNLRGDLHDDPRRVYQLSLRREEQDFRVVIVPSRASERTGLNVWRGGRVMADVVALRSRGMAGPIRISAGEPPSGIECPDVWLGPHVDRAPLIITAQPDVPFDVAALQLTAHADLGAGECSHVVLGGTSAVTQSPVTAGRITSEITLGVGPESPILVKAQPLETNVSQGGLVEVQVMVERKNRSHPSSTELTAVGLPPLVSNQLATIAAGENQGWISFELPAALGPGPYTFALQAVTEVLLDDGNKISVPAVSNPITLNVSPAPFLLRIDPHTPQQIARGEIVQLNYTADRKNGFIGKIHTELRATGGLSGLRARGVTFVGGTSAGVIQIIASDDAPLGPVEFLHLDAIGTVEDEPVYRAGCFVDLEIVP